MSTNNKNDSDKYGVRFAGIDWDKETLKLERRVGKARDEEQKKRKNGYNTEKQKYQSRAKELSFLCGFFCFRDKQSLTEVVKKSNGFTFISLFMPLPPSSSNEDCLEIFEAFLHQYRIEMLKSTQSRNSIAENSTIALAGVRRKGRGSLLKKVLREFFDAREYPLNEIDLQRNLNVFFYWKKLLDIWNIYTPLDRFFQYLFSMAVDTLEQIYIPHDFLSQFYQDEKNYMDRFLERTLIAKDLTEAERRGFQDWEDRLKENGSYVSDEVDWETEIKAKLSKNLLSRGSKKDQKHSLKDTPRSSLYRPLRDARNGPETSVDNKMGLVNDSSEIEENEDADMKLGDSSSNNNITKKTTSHAENHSDHAQNIEGFFSHDYEKCKIIESRTDSETSREVDTQDETKHDEDITPIRSPANITRKSSLFG